MAKVATIKTTTPPYQQKSGTPFIGVVFVDIEGSWWVSEGSPKQVVHTLTGVPTELFETGSYIYIMSRYSTTNKTTLYSYVYLYI